MDKTTLTSIIKAKGGKITASGKSFVCYELPMHEGDFIEFRNTIPFNSIWHSGYKNNQRFCIFYDRAA